MCFGSVQLRTNRVHAHIPNLKRTHICRVHFPLMQPFLPVWVKWKAFLWALCPCWLTPSWIRRKLYSRVPASPTCAFRECGLPWDGARAAATEQTNYALLYTGCKEPVEVVCVVRDRCKEILSMDFWLKSSNRSVTCTFNCTFRKLCLACVALFYLLLFFLTLNRLETFQILDWKRTKKKANTRKMANTIHRCSPHYIKEQKMWFSSYFKSVPSLLW